MILQPATVYENHRIYLMKNGVDLTNGGITAMGNMAYNANGYWYTSNAGANGAGINILAEYLMQKRFVFYDVASPNGQSNWGGGGGVNSTGWISSTGPSGWYNKSGAVSTTYGFTSLQIKPRMIIRPNFNLLRQPWAATDKIFISVKYAQFYIYNVFVSNYSNDYTD